MPQVDIISVEWQVPFIYIGFLAETCGTTGCGLRGTHQSGLAYPLVEEIRQFWYLADHQCTPCNIVDPIHTAIEAAGQIVATVGRHYFIAHFGN